MIYLFEAEMVRGNFIMEVLYQAVAAPEGVEHFKIIFLVIFTFIKEHFLVTLLK